MATVIQGTQQFQGAFKEMWLVTETVNFANAATWSRGKGSKVVGNFHKANRNRFKGTVRLNNAIVRC